MKNLKFLFAAIVLTCFVGISQSNAQAYIEKGSQYKDIVYEIDGVLYGATAIVDYQYEITPSGVFNWVSRGYIVQSYKWDDGVWVPLDEVMMPKSTIEAVDAWTYYDERITVNPQGRVLVVAHSKN